jgi:hypothetical protein
VSSEVECECAGGIKAHAKTPSVRCALNLTSSRAHDIQVGPKVVAVGVGFFDFTHRQTGHTNNYIELHPLFSLRPFGQ